MPAAVQALPTAGDKAVNLGLVDSFARQATQRGMRIVVFPELFLTGYNLGRALEGLAEPLDGPSVLALKRIAAKHGTALVVGLPERRHGALWNAAVVIDRQGQLRGAYRKIHLFGETEPRLFRRGDALCVVDVDGLKVGVAICYDIEFPEMARALVRAGADVICVPTANMEPYREVPTTLVRARALENGVPVVYANLSGQEGDLTYTGLSGIVGPDGIDLARAGPVGDALLMADPDLALTGLRAGLSTQAADLRPTALCQLSDGLT